MDILYTVACLISDNKCAGKTIEITFWRENMDSKLPVVTIATDECSMTLTIQDLPKLNMLLECAISKWELLSNDK